MKTKTTPLVLLLVISMGGCVNTTPQDAASNPPSSSKEVVETKPDAPLAANTRFAAGQLAETRGDIPQAIQQYEAGLKIEPNSAARALKLGMLYTGLRQFDPAINAWNRYIKVTHQSAAGYCNLGLTLEMAHRRSEAESAYKNAIARDVKNEPAHVNYGLMLARLNRINESLAQLQMVLTPAEAHYDVASVLETQGKTDAARAEYEQALKLDPQMSDAHSRLSALDADSIQSGN